MEVNLISIEVTPDIAAKIRGLAEAGVFAIHTGNANLNFHEGILKSVKTELFTTIKSYTQQEFDSPAQFHAKLIQ